MTYQISIHGSVGEPEEERALAKALAEVLAEKGGAVTHFIFNGGSVYAPSVAEALSDPASSAAALEELSKEDLKAAAAEADLPVSGTKSDLVDRLTEAGVEPE